MEDLKFKHLPMYQAFIKRCGLFIKVSKTQAISALAGEKYKFKQDDSVSLIKAMNYSSFNQGSMKSSYDKKRATAAALTLIEYYNKEINK